MKDRTQHLHAGGAAPIVIHHEEEPTVLARWLKAGLGKGLGFWLFVVGGTVVGLGAVIGISAMMSRPPESSKAWLQVMVPSTKPQVTGATKYEGMPAPVRALLAAADESPESPASRWAVLRAGILLYQEGLRDLPNQRETARPTLRQSIDMFDRVLKDAPKDAPEALVAAMSKARALESLGELDDAVKQYDQVASSWSKTTQAEAAKKRATELADPSVRKFYDDFYTMDLSQIPNLNTGAAGAGSSGVPGSLFGTPVIPNLGDIPGLTPGGSVSPASGTQPTLTPGGDFPKDLFAPSGEGDDTPAKPDAATTAPTEPPKS